MKTTKETDKKCINKIKV